MLPGYVPCGEPELLLVALALTLFLTEVHQNLTQVAWDMKCAPFAPSQLTAGVM